MDDILTRLVNDKAERKPVCLCVVIKTQGSVPRHAGSKMLVYSEGATVGSVGGGGLESAVRTAALQALKTGKPDLLYYSLNKEKDVNVGICGGNVSVYIEPHTRQPLLLILGAGHVGKAVAKMAQPMNFKIIITDDREDVFSEYETTASLETLTCPLAEVPKYVDIDENTYIVGVTRGADVDIAGLPTLLKTKPAYIGLIGSRKRWQFAKEGLLAAGVTEEVLTKIKTPIGLDIKAETPEEIAVSILAEVISYKNQPKR